MALPASIHIIRKLTLWTFSRTIRPIQPLFTGLFSAAGLRLHLILVHGFRASFRGGWTQRSAENGVARSYCRSRSAESHGWSVRSSSTLEGAHSIPPDSRDFRDIPALRPLLIAQAFPVIQRQPTRLPTCSGLAPLPASIVSYPSARALILRSEWRGRRLAWIDCRRKYLSPHRCAEYRGFVSCLVFR